MIYFTTCELLDTHDTLAQNKTDGQINEIWRGNIWAADS